MKIPGIRNQRGLGLMLAFDMPDVRMRDNVIVECARRGLLLLGCGQKGVRIIPPYVAKTEDADCGLDIISAAVKKCREHRFRHSGSVCEFIHCGRHHA